MSLLSTGWKPGSLSRREPGTERRPDASPQPGPAPARPASTGPCRLALWFGLVTGLLETALRLALRYGNGRVTLETIRTNHHWIWMTPASDLLLFAAAGALLALLARRWPAGVARVGPYLFGFAAYLALLLTIPGLYGTACLVLACGLALRTAPLIRARAPRFGRLVRTTTPWLAGLFAVLAAVAGSHAALRDQVARLHLPAARPGAPNVLLIVMDDVRIDALSLYGYHRETTPNLARLAEHAIRFDQARATAPWTLPSHASMLTGRWPHELSVRVDRPLDAAFPTLAGFLAGRGYATAGLVANTYYCNSWYGLDRGFSHYEDFAENRLVSVLEIVRSSTLGKRLVAAAGIESATPGARSSRKSAAMINRAALDWLEHRGSRPFFLFLNYYDAHAPFQPPAGFDRRFGLSAQPLATQQALLSKFSRLSHRPDPDPAPPQDAQAIVREAAALLRDSYDNCITYLDEQLGQLFAALEQRGLLDNTLVIVTSDHGEHFNDHHLFGHGNSLYGSLIHVPLLIVPPGGISPGRIVDTPVSLRNLPATMADLAGLHAASPFPGQSLARCWTSASGDGSVAFDDPVLAEVEHQKKFRPSPQIPASLGPLQALVSGRWNYIRNSNGREELYDYLHDPGELVNRAGARDAAPLLAPLRHDLKHHLGELPRP